MSEVGLRSVYSDFAHRSTATQAQPVSTYLRWLTLVNTIGGSYLHVSPCLTRTFTSVYCDLSGQPGDYASLQMSDVGMTSTYSELGQHDGVAPAHGGTDYEIPP
ncbi:uncharacterized protein [Littorina saxatilis]